MAKIIGGTTSTTMRVPKEWEEIEDITIAEDTASNTTNTNKNYTEVFVECVLDVTFEPSDGTSKSINFNVGRYGSVVTRNVISVKSGEKVYFRAHGYLSPSKTTIYDTTAGKLKYLGNMVRNCNDYSTKNYDQFKQIYVSVGADKNVGVTPVMCAGSTIKIWGR